jgi:hypothetical protein
MSQQKCDTMLWEKLLINQVDQSSTQSVTGDKRKYINGVLILETHGELQVTLVILGSLL